VFRIAEHVWLGFGAFLIVLALQQFTTNRLVRRKLRLSLALIAAFLAIATFLIVRPVSGDTANELRAFEKLALAAGLINALVFTLVNPLRQDRVPDRFPVILQDAMVIGLVLLAAMVLSSQLVTTSAVSAVVLGFALQDTLGNAFAGLAIQSEKPFHVGDWVTVGEHEGRVAEVTWRATKLRTKNGNFVVLPNNVVAKEPIVNYSQPAAPTRLQVEVGASYLERPNTVKAALTEALQRSPLVLAAPAPQIELIAFGDSAITYCVRFWIEDFEQDDIARDQVRTAIFYAFQRHGVDIPWPIQVEYSREWPEPDVESATREVAASLSTVEMLSALPADVRREIETSSTIATYGSGEPIVRQGEAGQSMFVVAQGEVSVVVEPSRQEVARIGAGGFFGEMSLLTGEPRSATVVAVGDVRAIELSADLFRKLAAAHPAAVEQLGVVALTRRAELDRARTTASGAVAVETTALLARMKRFLRLA
jgi:small-conductance mechanosensitive channel/CRP-like cAMP-binding protein